MRPGPAAGGAVPRRARSRPWQARRQVTWQGAWKGLSDGARSLPAPAAGRPGPSPGSGSGPRRPWPAPLSSRRPSPRWPAAARPVSRARQEARTPVSTGPALGRQVPRVQVSKEWIGRARGPLPERRQAAGPARALGLGSPGPPSDRAWRSPSAPGRPGAWPSGRGSGCPAARGRNGCGHPAGRIRPCRRVSRHTSSGAGPRGRRGSGERRAGRGGDASRSPRPAVAHGGGRPASSAASSGRAATTWHAMPAATRGAATSPDRQWWRSAPKAAAWPASRTRPRAASALRRE